MSEQSIIYCVCTHDCLDLYAKKSNGSTTYLMTHRFNPTLFGYLKNGKTVRELRTFRPTHHRGEKAIEHSITHVINVFDYLSEQEAA